MADTKKLKRRWKPTVSTWDDPLHLSHCTNEETNTERWLPHSNPIDREHLLILLGLVVEMTMA